MGLVLFVLIGLTGCASNPQKGKVLHFPAELASPYLSLVQIISGDTAPTTGLLSKVSRLLFGSSASYRLDQPTDMTVDSQGRLLIVDSGTSIIHRFIREDGIWQYERNFQISELSHPIAIASGNEHLFISDLQTGKVFILDEDLKIKIQLKDSTFDRPGDLCYDGLNKRILISDPAAGRVYIYTLQGEKLGELGGALGGAGSLQSPVSVAVNASTGSIFVLDGLARKVKQFGSDLSYSSSFGQYDQVPGSFAFPKDITQSTDGVLFVSDAAFGNIQMFDPSGALLYFFGENGTDPGQFLMPRNLHLDADQYLYIADPYNNRVQIFQYHAQP